MGGKKKAAAVPEEDDSVDRFWRAYKNKCKALEVKVSPIIKDKYDLFVDEAMIPSKFHIWQELGSDGCKAIMEALKDTK